MEADFSGYATKAGLKCSDGRTIMPDAFKHQDKMSVPLVWQHGHGTPTNVLGHAILENREDGVYAYGFFNESEQGKNAKVLVQHGDVVSLSIYANQLVERAKQVFHGAIREVSLVLAGANPGAKIDFVAVQHADGEIDELQDEAVITTGLELVHADESSSGSTATATESKESDDSEEETIEDVYKSLNEKQKNVVHFMIGAALEEASSSDDNDESSAEHSDNDEDNLNHQEGTEMTRNVFEQASGATTTAGPSLSHDQIRTIVEDAQRLGSLKESFLQHAVEYGIENIDFLFPDARNIQNAPEFISRRMEWVSSVINGAKKSPFSRIKTVSADITHDEARAKGYVKGNLKKEEWFALSKRVTTPTTIYKKQKLDRDDIIDITDLDVVAWLKAEMRVMLDEEIARAVLLGDGREVDDEDKINETNIRPIAYDDDFYAHKVPVPVNVSQEDLVEAVLRARTKYRGTGNPTAYMTEDVLVDLLLAKDRLGRRLYASQADLQTALRVKDIQTVDPMESYTVNGGALLMVLVNLQDYVVGADKGGKVEMFDDFDIDYNQYKYLIEGRMSGALTKFKSAMVVYRDAAGTTVTPEVPDFDPETGVITIPTQTGVVYHDASTGVPLAAGAQGALNPGGSFTVEATPDTGYYFPHNIDTDWTFTRPAA